MGTFLHGLATQQLERVVTPAQLDAEYILESLEQAAPMLRNLARHYDMDVDDLNQEAFLVCHKIMSDPAKPHTRPYLHGAIRIHVFDLASKRKLAVSLDAPLSDESDMSLIDLLVAPQKPQQTRRDYYRKRALLKALRRLPEHYQRAVSLFYGIERLSVLGRDVKERTLKNNRVLARSALRRDARLNKAVMQTWR